MITISLTHWLQLAAIAHLGLMGAGLTMPRVVQLAKHTAPLPVFVRRLFWVYYTFIGFCLLSFGLLTYFFAGTLAEGSPLARAVCGFLAGFWTIRLVAALFIFDVNPYLTNSWLRLGYGATNIVFAALPVIYAWAAFH